MGKKSAFRCAECQTFKLLGRGHGLLPEIELKQQPFEECTVHLIGSWQVKIHGKEHISWLQL